MKLGYINLGVDHVTQTHGNVPEHSSVQELMSIFILHKEAATFLISVKYAA
jgi:hypothetical protein